MTTNARHLTELLPVETAVRPSAASGTGSAASALANVQARAGLAAGTGAAYLPTVDPAFAGVASATATSRVPTLSIKPSAEAASASGAALLPIVNVSPAYPSTVQATASIGTPTISGVTLATPLTIGAIAAVYLPPTLGTLVAVSTISITGSLGTPVIRHNPQPGTISLSAAVTRPSIHVNLSGIIPTTPRWSLHDPDTGQTYEFDINPSEEEYQPFSKNILYKNTLPRKSIIYEVQKDATSLSWSGTVLLEGQLGALQSWFDTRATVHLVDDLGREFDIYITEFAPKRVRNVDFPWYHTYDMKALVLS